MELYFVFFFFLHSLQVLLAAPPVEVTPERIILLENRPLEVKCRVDEPITYCRFAVPGIPNALSLRPGIAPHQGIEYSGRGLEKGECGMLIRGVSSKHSGIIQCSMGFFDQSAESTGNSTLIVARRPDPPLLKVYPGSSYSDSFLEGEVIQANCRIQNARPIANISWYLGSEPIYDRLSPIVTEEENGLMTISQNLTRKVTYLDHGKDLKCVAGHIALGQGDINHSIHKLNIRFPPKPKSQELEKFGFTIGQPGKIVVTFHAYPIPNIVWKVDQENLKQGSRDRTGRFEAGILQHKGAGIWDAVLIINTVRAEEVEKRYTLIAQNELGQESYKVAISTSPEPPADITAGAIVGIVIAVLVILLLVFILIFARATGRWCFAGGVPRPPGESKWTKSWSLRRKDPAKVNSLVYKDYTLVNYKDGRKSYVSPEEKAQLLLDGKIRPEISKIHQDEERKRQMETDSESEYEIPVVRAKPKSCENLLQTTRPEFKRNSSLPLFESETPTGDTEKINLPPYIVPVETSLTYPMIRKKQKNKKTKSKDETESEMEGRHSDEVVIQLPEDYQVRESADEVDTKNNRFSLKSLNMWRKNGKGKEESENKEDESEVPKKGRFSLPWTKRKSEEGKEGQKLEEKSDEPNSHKSPFSFRRLSWKSRKNGDLPVNNITETQEVTVEEFGNEVEKKDETEDEDREPFSRRDFSKRESDDQVGIKVESPVEVFPSSLNLKPEETEKDRTDDDESRYETKRMSHGFRLPQFPKDIATVKDLRSRNRERIETNPLKKMFGIRTKNVRVENPQNSTVDTVSSIVDDGHDGVEEVNDEQPNIGSDTESADHGSADKSSMSKLTSEKQPKKLMSGLLSSFKKGKNKDKVADNDITKNPPSFEITVKDQAEEGAAPEGVRAEGIVYAELDMARSPGNVMRRDDEKTEYAEIIYPGSKMTSEKAMEELRKSRENLTSSRENLAEIDEAYSTTTTVDGKKEAAV